MDLIICDDEKIFLKSTEQIIRAWAQKTGHSSGLMIHSFTSSEDVLDAWERGMKIDALFLDIQIPGEMSGLDLAKIIFKSNEYIPIVFITSYGEYAEEGYTVSALRYLRKPISERAIAECMNIIWHRWELQNTECIVLDLPTQFLRLPADNVLYIEVLGHYCTTKTTDEHEVYKTKQSLDTIRKKLPNSIFAQSHRSYLVNLKYIRHISGSTITMANRETIPLSRKYQQEFMRKFRDYYLEGEK